MIEDSGKGRVNTRICSCASRALFALRCPLSSCERWIKNPHCITLPSTVTNTVVYGPQATRRTGSVRWEAWEEGDNYTRSISWICEMISMRRYAITKKIYISFHKNNKNLSPLPTYTISFVSLLGPLPTKSSIRLGIVWRRVVGCPSWPHMPLPHE